MAKHKLDILVVDDHEITRRSFRRALEYLEYTCDFAEDGETCLEMMAKKPYEVIFLDLVMPGLDGEEVLKQLAEKYPGADVVVVSVQDDELIIEELLSMGATAYLTKPFTMESIQGIIEKLEEKRS